MKLIIAPHVIDENHLVEIIGKLKRPYVRYTRADEKNVLKADCLIIDCFGLLSSIYRYGEIAYIGGGFGVGIHNTLEAAVYGIPVIFGPKYQKFMKRGTVGSERCLLHQRLRRTEKPVRPFPDRQRLFRRDGKECRILCDQ